MKQIEIYTDGSCKGNPGPGGWGTIFLEKKSQTPFEILKGHEVHTTNNRMEMTAVIEALRYLDHHKLHSAQITLYSDSSLIIQTLLQGWKRKANLDLWEELDEFNESLDINYVWVKGHSTNKWNNECDKVAQNQSTIAQKKSFQKNSDKSKKIFQKKSQKKGPTRERGTSDFQQELF